MSSFLLYLARTNKKRETGFQLLCQEVRKKAAVLSKGVLAVTDPTIGYLGTREMFKTVILQVF